MKKFVAVFLSAVLMLSLVACSSKTLLVESVDASDLETSKLFNDVYLPFAKQEQSLSLENIKKFLADGDYPYYYAGSPIEAVYVYEDKHGYSDRIYFSFYNDPLISSGVYYSQSHSRNEVYYADNEEKKGLFVQEYLTKAIEVQNIEEQISFLKDGITSPTPASKPSAKNNSSGSSSNNSIPGLFNDVYKHFASNPRYVGFDDVIAYVETMGYAYDSTSEPLDSITVYENSSKTGRNVYFAFAPFSDGLYPLSINYIEGSTFASWSNYSSDRSSSYDIFEVTTPEGRSEVESIAEQAKILFAD